MVIACGGGGIPVAWEGDRLVGVEGVVDKDSGVEPAGSQSARPEADHRDLGGPRCDLLRHARPAMVGHDHRRGRRASTWQAGEFPAGSMGPKIEAGIDFVDARRQGVHHHLYGMGGARASRRGRHPHRGVMILTNARILTFDDDQPRARFGQRGNPRRRLHRVRALRPCDWLAHHRSARAAADARADQRHTHLYSTLARGIHLPGRAALRTSPNSEEAVVAPRPRAHRRGRLLQRPGRPDRFGQMRRGHGDRPPLQAPTPAPAAWT